MLRLYHVLLGGLMLVLVPLGIKFARPQFSSSTKSPSSAQTTPVTTPSPNQDNIWNQILGKTPAPVGWQVAACQGNAPLLCVSSGQKNLGTVEVAVYPLSKQPDFQKMLASAGIAPGSKVDYQNPKYQLQVLTALKSWVADHYATFQKDRKPEYGDKITFAAQPPQTIPFGKLQGMRYEFAGRKREGGIHERHVGYITYDGKSIYVISTAFDTASQTGKFEKLENLSLFEPYLSATVADLRLPK